MNGYAKIKSAKSRSIDFSDLTTVLPQNPKTQETKKDICSNQEDDHGHEEIQENGKMFGEPVLKRNKSITSSSSTSLNGVKKWGLLTMRRSSSVSESYSRIHDQSVTLAPFIDDVDDDDEKMETRSMKKKHRTNKILKVCKRLFGISL